MESVGSYEAKTHLASLLERVGKGERFAITKHGIPIAVLVPFPGATKPDPQSAIEALRVFRKGHSLNGLSIRDMIEEGRRY